MAFPDVLRIVHLIDAQGGGALTHVLTFAGEASRDCKADVTVVFFLPGPVEKAARDSGVKTVVIRKRGPLGMAFVLKLSRYLRENRVDILHTHTINSNFYGRLAGALSGVPVVTTVHSYMIDELSGLNANTRKAMMLFRIDKLMAPLTKRFIAVSPGIRGRLLENGVEPGKISVVTHGIEMPRLDVKDDIAKLRGALGLKGSSFVVAIAGRLVELKSHNIFLKAAAILAGEPGRDIEFLIVGDGPLMEKLKAMSRSLGIEERVRFTGWRTDMENIYPAIDALALCSSTESQGLVLVEAMAYRKAVVATDVNEVGKTVINEKTGLLIPPGDADALAEGIKRLMDDRSLRERLGEEGRVFAEENFSVKKMAENIIKAYRDVKGRAV